MYEIYHDVFIKTSPHKAFEAISQPSKMINWWPLKCSGKPEQACVYNFFFTEDYDWFGKVSHVEENRLFYIKMVDADEDWNPTTFGYELQAKDDGVLVCFSHKGWPVNNHHFRRSSYCWAILLRGLKDYLEDGAILPFEDRG